MSQTKVQLIAPIGIVTASTVEITGVVTATTLVGDIAGTVTGITSTTDNLDVGIVTATAFVGDFTGTASSIVTGSNVTAGIITGTKFVGNATGTVSGLADDTNINVGILTSTSFVGDLTGNAAGLSTTTANLSLGIVTATSFAGNITGNAAGISVTTTNANLGIITASAFHGDGTNLSGVSAGPVSQQAVTANSSTTTIDLSSGNLIYMTQSANTTVAFANTEGNTDVVYLVRTKDDNTTARTLTWPSGIVWDGGSEPTIVDVNATDDYHVFKLTTRDNGATWYGKEVFKNKSGGELYTWGGSWSGAAHGGGGYGYLGHNDSTQYSSPTQIPGIGWAVNASTSGQDNKSFTGEYHAGSLKTDGTLWVWGYNNRGQLGQNNTTNYSSPVQVPGTTWNTMMYGGYNCSGTHAIKTDGTLWTWGYNNAGQLGDSSKTTRSSPVQVPGTTWKSCFRAGHTSAATKTDGTLWAWGANTYGALGQNNRTEYMSPVQVGSATDWNYVTGGGDNHVFAIKTDGTLWHSGGGGGSAQNTAPVTRSSPVQITSATNWAKVNATGGAASTLALRTDGTLWAWGHNANGTLGQNSINTPDGNWISSPTQIPGTTWNDITGWYTTAVATKSDGTLWGWGAGSYLNISQGSGPAHTSYSSPTQIPGAWSQGLSGSSMIMSWKA